MNNGIIKRISSFSVAIVVLASLFSGVLPASAADLGSFAFSVSEGTTSYISSDATATIEITFYDNDDILKNDPIIGKKIPHDDIAIKDKKNWGLSSSSFVIRSLGDKVYSATLNGAKPTVSIGSKSSLDLDFSVNYNSNSYSFTGYVDKKYFEKPLVSGEAEEKENLKNDIIIENIIVTDSNNKELKEITKETPTFNVTILFQDPGVDKVDMQNLPDNSLSAFIRSSVGFDTTDNTKGKLTLRPSASDGTHRFKAEFNNLKYNEAGTDLVFRVQYRIDDQLVNSDVTAKIPQAQPPKKEEEEKEKEKISPLKPYIIVNEYSYGEEQIQAGSEFTLDISYKNTSSSTLLENIKLTVTTPEDVSIASSSNTIYVTSLGANQALSHSFDLIAKPSAKVGSADIQLDFTYQYIDIVNKKREEGTTTEKIAIPITQIDRFALDPIKEIPEATIVGEEFDITISFINRGKSPTYNISTKATSKGDISTATEHFGNLEAGKSGEVTLSLIANELGELKGDVVVQYEDENTNQKEIKVPFSLYVGEPYIPDPVDPVDPNAVVEPTKAVPLMTYILCSVGLIFILTPIVIYFAKRAKKKESEEIDEDF